MGDVTEPDPPAVTGSAPRGLAGTGGVETHVGALPPVGTRPATGSEGTAGIAGRPAGGLTGRDGTPGTEVGTGREAPPTAGRPPVGTSEVTPVPPVEGSWADGRPPVVPADALPEAPLPCADTLPLA